MTATLKLFQESSETFRDGWVDRIVPGPKALPDFPQPWHLRQDVTTFGLARPTLPVRRAAASLGHREFVTRERRAVRFGY